MIAAMRAFFKEDTAGTLVEYALIVGLIILAIIATAGLLGNSVETGFSEPAVELGQIHEQLD